VDVPEIVSTVLFRVLPPAAGGALFLQAGMMHRLTSRKIKVFRIDQRFE
jgi:hypothetical protein